MQRIGRMIAGGVLTLAVALTGAACSGDEKPSKSEVHAMFTEQMVGPDAEATDDVAPIIDCMVDDIYANVSDEGLRQMVDDPDTYVPEEGDAEVLARALSDCVTVAQEAEEK